MCGGFLEQWSYKCDIAMVCYIIMVRHCHSCHGFSIFCQMVRPLLDTAKFLFVLEFLRFSVGHGNVS